jgi:hypothetical protein
MYKKRITKPSEGLWPKINITPRISPMRTTIANENKSPSNIEILMSAFNCNLSLLFKSVSVIVDGRAVLLLSSVFEKTHHFIF